MIPVYKSDVVIVGAGLAGLDGHDCAGRPDHGIYRRAGADRGDGGALRRKVEQAGMKGKT